MSSLGNTSELEAELIKRNREIAKVRDEVLKAERRLEESQMRNDDLLEKNAELDAEVTTKSRRIGELEGKVTSLEQAAQSKDGELQKLQQDHTAKLEEARREFEQGSTARAQEQEAMEKLNGQISDLSAHKERLEQEVQEEQRRHADTKVRLEQSESSARETANESLKQRRQLKELEEKLVEKEASLTSAQALQLEEERAKMGDEILRVKAALEEQRALREDLEMQVREREQEVLAARGELEDLKRERTDHAVAIKDLEAERDSALRQAEQQQTGHDDFLRAERKRNEEHLERAMQQAASLDGRLSGQRMMLQEANQALVRSEDAEEQMAAKYMAEARELAEARESATEELEREMQKASKQLSACSVQFSSELASEEVCLRRHAHSEVDAATRSLGEAEDKERRLEARLQALLLDHEEAASHHSRTQDALRSQGSDLRQRLADTEERGLGHQQEAERLKRDLEEARLEAERTLMAHRLELERLQQTLEAETQSRNSAEKVAQSQLEEKATLLEHRNAAIERLEQDLENAKKKVEELEEAAVKAQEGTDTKVHGMGVRNAQLEGELRAKHERLTEVEGRLDAQRQYLEQLNASFSQAQTDRDALMQAKGSLEAQLKHELSHRDAVTVSLQQAHDDSSRRFKELEERMLKDREAHRDAMDEVKRSMAEELKQGSERLSAVEAELLTARQRCEVLMRNKADLQQEVGEHRDKHSALEASAQEHRAQREQLGLELEQQRQSRSALEQDMARLQEEKSDCEKKINELVAQVRTMEEQHGCQRDDFSIKVQKLDELLNKERDLREAAERSLSAVRQDSENQSLQYEQDRKKTEQELRTQVDSWREKAGELEAQLGQSKEAAEAQRTRAEELDGQRREAESQLRGEAATAGARIQRLEAEVQRKDSLLEDAKATLAQHQATSNSRIAGLERHLEQEAQRSKEVGAAKEAAENEVQRTAQNRGQMMERLGMAAEELFTRQIEFALDKQRLSGALEESRRTLRNSLGVPSPVAAVDSVRIAGLEQQLSEERRKSIEQIVKLQRTERRCSQLEETQRRTEEQRGDAVQQARDADRRCVVLSEDLRKAQLKQNVLELRCEEVRERAAMSAAEMSTIRYEAKYEAAKLRGALDELRYMLKMQEGPQTGAGGYPARRAGVGF